MKVLQLASNLCYKIPRDAYPAQAERSRAIYLSTGKASRPARHVPRFPVSPHGAREGFPGGSHISMALGQGRAGTFVPYSFTSGFPRVVLFRRRRRVALCPASFPLHLCYAYHVLPIMIRFPRMSDTIPFYLQSRDRAPIFAMGARAAACSKTPAYGYARMGNGRRAFPRGPQARIFPA